MSVNIVRRGLKLKMCISWIQMNGKCLEFFYIGLLLILLNEEFYIEKNNTMLPIF